MKLKANFHLHTSEDSEDRFIWYSAKKAIDYAALRDFSVLALTLHDTFGYTDELAAYAKERGILLIPGIEKTIEGAHVLIINANKQAETITTFKQLAAYRAAHPECFTLAAHPFYGNIGLREKLFEFSELFDAVEQSWFYKAFFNGNRKAAAAATKLKKPLIATSDTHRLRYLNNSYTLIEVEQPTAEAVMTALRLGAVTNVSQPASWSAFVWQAWVILRNPGQLSIMETLRAKFARPRKQPISVVPAGEHE